ncbi:MAG TPA: TonB-dependent receptor, partial [Novosphingobium sp.]|nr:TonB-dependent receptor [Novosphingobium sp.]
AESARADEAPHSEPSAAEIIVTANKRQQSINTVPLSITAASGDTLMKRGINSTADLARIVPGLTAQPSPFNTPVYTLRGVGFYESTLSASPTVAVYTDEVPLPFSAMTKAASLDLERVEVLKGPQGTLFGNNTTGGAINYIAAKPTDTFKAGVNGSFGRFDTVDLQGFVSGPLTDNLKGRVAARIVESGPWQYSATRADTLGATRELQGRILLEWTPSPRLKITFNLNGWIDKSDTQAPQRIATYISVPGNPPAAATLAYPYPPQNARAADWSTNIGALRNDDYFVQGALRADYTINPAMTLTSITAYERYKENSTSDFDGTARNIADNYVRGYIDTVSQELRLTGKLPRFNWVLGANYEYDWTYDRLYYNFSDSTTSWVSTDHMTFTSNFTRQDVQTAAIFANGEYEVLPGLTLQGGLRYTDSRRKFSGCTLDEPGGGVAEAFNLIESWINSGTFVTIPEGGCVTFHSSPDINGATGLYGVPYVNPIQSQLNEQNLSWRTGVNYRTANHGLLYATVSRGYKAGSFPTTSASFDSQYKPVKQESLTAYEVGFKQPLLDRKVQLNGALFYYDYKDKQLRGRILDAVFGPLDALVQIPKSRVWGAEAELNARPIKGLVLDVAATYLDTKILSFTGYNNAGDLQNYAGTPFPYAPKWEIVGSADYDFPVNGKLNAFLGTSLTYNSATQGSIGSIPELAIKAYALLDAQIGVRDPGDKWRFQIWGRNLTNTYYWTNALQSQDVYLRFTGKPVTYGMSFSYRF